MSQSIDLAALLCSRLVHDMLSPVGELSNGIELLRDERDPEMRQRLSTLNPKSSARVANRLLEACERRLWEPDDDTLEALRNASDELEDRLEGVFPAE